MRYTLQNLVTMTVLAISLSNSSCNLFLVQFTQVVRIWFPPRPLIFCTYAKTFWGKTFEVSGRNPLESFDIFRMKNLNLIRIFWDFMWISYRGRESRQARTDWKIGGSGAEPPRKISIFSGWKMWNLQKLLKTGGGGRGRSPRKIFWKFVENLPTRKK